jgi:tetratricopeptide (TPR) repeat protein
MALMTPGHLLAIALACALAVPVHAAQDTRTRARAAQARAAALEAAGNHTAALSLLWEAASLAPGDADVQNALGEALDRIGALDAAVAAFERAVAARPAFRTAANNLVLALVKAGRGGEAVERARALAAGAPEDAEALFTLGLAQIDHDTEAAVATFRRVLRLAPRHALARYNLALVFRRTDRLNDAVQELHRAIALEPRAEAHYTLGVVYWHAGDLPRARRALEEAVAAAPDYADAHHALGAVLKGERDLAGAARALRRAIELRPDRRGAHNTLGLVLQMAGDEAGAARHLAEGERLAQRAQAEMEAGVWTAVGMQKLDAGDHLAALDAFRRATASVGTYAPAYYQMGRALRALGAEESAQEAFARARQLNPDIVAGDPP